MPKRCDCSKCSIFILTCLGYNYNQMNGTDIKKIAFSETKGESTMRIAIRRLFFLLFLMIPICLVGCGRTGEKMGVQNPVESEIIISDSSVIYDVDVETNILNIPDHCLGVQYDGERAVAFYSMYDESVYAYDGTLYEYDITNDRFQILLTELPQELINGGMTWYRTTNGHYYVYNDQSFYCLDKNGEELCWQHTEGKLVQISETSRQDVVMLFYDSSHYIYHLGLFSLAGKKLEDKGQLAEVDAIYHIAPGYKEDVLVLNSRDGIYDINLDTMQRTYYLKWDTVSYSPTQGQIMDFRQTGNGECELLAYSYEQNLYYRDLLAVKSFDEEGRAIITYRTGYTTDSMKNLVVAFNQSQSEYYVVLESSELGSAMDDGQKNAIEIAAGRGPDLIDDSALNNIYDLIRQGALEDLSPYIADSGIDTEEYFPAAFAKLNVDGGIYGICYEQGLRMTYMDEEVFSATEDMDISTLLYCLETYEKDKVVFNNKYIYIPLKILNYYLELSDDLYGMIDWENHTCDFDNPLWYQMLETANRYGFRNGRNNYEDVAFLGFFTDFPSYMTDDGNARNEHMIPVGYPVEDTMCPVLHLTAIGINSQSPNKEGAWAFLEFCLSQTAQEKTSYFPVRRDVFARRAEKTLENLAMAERPLTQVQIDDLTNLLEDGRADSIRNLYPLAIIAEECDSYFNGDKSAEEVTKIIENRVGLYLQEID